MASSASDRCEMQRHDGSHERRPASTLAAMVCLKPGGQRIAGLGQVERAAQDRQDRQDHQRHRDDLRAFLGVRGGRMPRLAEEDHPDLAAHVEGGEEGGDGQQPVDRRVAFLKRIRQDLILGPEAGKREDARQRQRADQVDPEGDRHRLAQAAHVAHVVRVEELFGCRRTDCPASVP